MKGTKFGPVVIPGNPETSNLIWLLEWRASPELRMPHGKKQLSTCDRSAIYTSIASAPEQLNGPARAADRGADATRLLWLYSTAALMSASDRPGFRRGPARALALDHAGNQRVGALLILAPKRLCRRSSAPYCCGTWRSSGYRPLDRRQPVLRLPQSRWSQRRNRKVKVSWRSPVLSHSCR